MRLHFHKMHGLGNDFVVIDGVRQRFALTTAQIRALADRHTGIGFDQLLLVEPSTAADCDFSYRIFNADGGEVGQCGNGARCFARFVQRVGLTTKTVVRVATQSGPLTLEILGDNVRANLGIPRFSPADIPFVADADQERYAIALANGEIATVGVVNVGNPHAVTPVAAVDQAPVAAWGPQLEAHSRFPARVNVGFMEVVTRQHIRLRVFERGVGETRACGSGACAAVLVGQRWGLLDDPITVALTGGELTVSQQATGVYLTGPAIFVYEGDVEG